MIFIKLLKAKKIENYSNFTVRNCSVPCCKGQHFIKFKQGKVVVLSWELSQIERCWKKNIEKLCGIKCENDNLCELHKKLNVFLFFSNYIRQRNIERNDVVSKIMIRENCKHPYCLNSWYFKVYETEYLTKDKSFSYRSQKY